MNTKYTNIRPTEEGSQYTAVWTYNNLVWSDCIKIIDGEHFIFNDQEDDWSDEDDKVRLSNFTEQVGQDLVTFIIKAED